ncbi:MAG TPA: amino acid deaminase, partial [Actinopolymorphaceae bacterium]
VPGTSDLEVGDRVCLGVAHPCTAFDKWRVVPIVDDERRIVDVARTLL